MITWGREKFAGAEWAGGKKKITPRLAPTAVPRPRRRRTRHNSMITSPSGDPGYTCKTCRRDDIFESRPAPFHRGRAEDLFEAPTQINEERNHGSTHHQPLSSFHP